MAKWSKQAKIRVRSYKNYRARLKEYSRRTGTKTKAVPYNVYKVSYDNAIARYRESEGLSSESKLMSPELSKIGSSVGTKLLRTENRPEVLYQDYKRTLENKVDSMLKKGQEPDSDEIMTFDEFRRAYNEYRHDLAEEVEKGERKTIGNIVNRIVSDQVYKISSKQLNTTYRAMLQWNQDHSDDQIKIDMKGMRYSQWAAKMRTGEIESTAWYDLIRAKREELFKKGWSKKEVSKEIRRTFYGSP